MARTRKRGRQRRWRIWAGISVVTVALLLAFGWYWGAVAGDRKDLLLEQARIAMAHGKGEQAIRFADAVIENRPGDVGALHVRARAEALLGRFDDCLHTLEGLLDRMPDRVDLRRMAGDVLARMGRNREAVEAYRGARTLSPEDATTWRCLARTLVRVRDFPAAEQAFRRAAELAGETRADVLIELCRMYMSVGLDAQTLDVLEETAQQDGADRTDRVITLGRAFEALGRIDRAGEFLATVPLSSNHYAACQVLLARQEQRRGRTEPARARMEALARYSTPPIPTVRAMAGLNVRHGRDRELIGWVDPLVDVEKLPAPLKAAWLRFRVAFADEAGDWPTVLARLNALRDVQVDLGGQSRGLIGTDAARIAMLIAMDRVDEARRAFGAADALAASELGSLIATVLGDDQNVARSLSAHLVFESAARGDVEGVRAAMNGMPSHATLYASDVSNFLAVADLSESGHRQCLRQLAVAAVARTSGLLGLSWSLVENVVDRASHVSIAHGLAAGVLMDRGLPTAGLLDRLRRDLPDSSLLRYLSAKELADRGDLGGAIRKLRELCRREPKNLQARQRLSGVLVQSGDIDGAITVLEGVYRQPGPFQASAGNALACLLAEHKPERLDEAYRIAGQTLQREPRSRPVLDTFAWIEHLRGNHERALALLNLAVLGGNSEPELHRHLGAVYLSLGNASWSDYHTQQADRSTSESSPKAHRRPASQPTGPVAYSR